MRTSRSLRIAIAVVASMAIAGGAYAFTAANTVPASNAGAGVGTVSGFTITNLHYGLNATDADEHRLADVHRQPGHPEHEQRQGDRPGDPLDRRPDHVHLHHEHDR